MRCTASGCRSRGAHPEYSSPPTYRSWPACRPARRSAFAARICAQLQTQSSKQPAGNRAAMASPSWLHRAGWWRVNACMMGVTPVVDEMAVLIDQARRRAASGLMKRPDQVDPDFGDAGRGASPETAQTRTNSPPSPPPSRRGGEWLDQRHPFTDEYVHWSASLCQMFREHGIRSTHRRHPVRRASITIS